MGLNNENKLNNDDEVNDDDDDNGHTGNYNKG